MNKFRNAIEEGKFAARALRHFYKCYRKWRDANPDEDVVYVYVGHPDMAAAIVKQSALWQRFAEWEKANSRTDLEPTENIQSHAARDLAATQAAVDAVNAANRRNPDPRKFTPVVVGPGNVRCACAACTASRATREESKAYDA